jgi:hypothetical protein
MDCGMRKAKSRIKKKIVQRTPPKSVPWFGVRK